MARTVPGDAIVVAIVSRKGGSGKTTVMHALAAGMGLHGRKVRVIETDDNRRFSRVTVAIDKLGRLKSVDDNRTAYGLFCNPQMAANEAVYRIPFDKQLAKLSTRSGLSQQEIGRLLAERQWTHPQDYELIPGSPALSVLESTQGMAANVDQRPNFNPHMRLAEAVGYMRRECDLILMDTAPMKTLVPHNAVAASDYVIFVLDFDPDSYFDLETSVAFVRDVQASCRQVGRPGPRILGVVYNKFNPKSRHDPVRLEVYTTRHFDEETRSQVDPLVQFPRLGLIRWDDERMKDSMQDRVSMHMMAPTSEIGTDMYDLCLTFERAVIGSGAGAAR